MQRSLTQITQGQAKREDYQRVEADLLRAARHLIRDGGLQRLTMVRVAQETGVTRKTVYNHFENVEDLVVALCIQSLTRRGDMMAQAAQFRGRSRERIAAIAGVARELLPHHMRHEVLLFAINMAQVPVDRQHRLRAQEERVLATVSGVIRDAVAAGDLKLPDDLTPERIALTLHQMEVGAFAFVLRGFGVGEHSVDVSLEAFFHTLAVFLDDLGWRPLSSEFDYLASIRRMWREVFPDVLQRFGAR